MLTTAELEALALAAQPCSSHRSATDAEVVVYFDLIEQGRIVLAQCPNHPDLPRRSFLATAAGREALKLWPTVKAALETA